MSNIRRKIIKKVAESILKSTNNKVVLFTKDVSELFSRLIQEENIEKKKSVKNPLAQFSHISKRTEGIKTGVRKESSSKDSSITENTNPDKNDQGKDIKSTDKESQKEKIQVVSAESINKRTLLILEAIRSSSSQTSLLKRIESLNQHIKSYPEGVSFASNNGATSLLLKLKHSSEDTEIIQLVNETLSLIGYCDPPPSTGVRILSIDGGGMRGLVVINILQQIESLSGKRIHQLFDYMCGVSTGAIIAFCSVPPLILPLEKLKQLYLELGKQIFKQNALKGASKLVFSSAYYETEVWEKLLKDYVGTTTMIETTRYPECPKISVLSTISNKDRITPFLFRNYAVPTEKLNDYPGSCNYTVFEAVRASSAAPSVFKEFRTEDKAHLDGGIVANNPAGVAIHEVKTLWPDEIISCLVSCGTGRPPSGKHHSKYTSWKRILNKVLESATDTEAVHQVLNDLLSDSVYYRFNPILSKSFAIDEVSEEKIALLEKDTADYCSRNEEKFDKVVKLLTKPRSLLAKSTDFIKLKIKLSEDS